MNKIKFMRRISGLFFLFFVIIGLTQQYYYFWVFPDEVALTLGKFGASDVESVVRDFTQRGSSYFIWFYLFCIFYYGFHVEVFSRLEREIEENNS